MPKELLAEDRSRPSTHHPKDQQCRLRDPPPGLACRQLVSAIDNQRQCADEHKPHRQRVRQQGAARSGKGQKNVTEVIEIHKAATASGKKRGQ